MLLEQKAKPFHRYRCPVPVIDRLSACMGNDHRVCVALGRQDSWCSKVRKRGYISEVWALDIDELGLVDEHGPITMLDVLAEARDVQLRLAAQREAAAG